MLPPLIKNGCIYPAAVDIIIFQGSGPPLLPFKKNRIRG